MTNPGLATDLSLSELRAIDRMLHDDDLAGTLSDSLAVSNYQSINTLSPAAFAEHASRGQWQRAGHLDYLDHRLLALACGASRTNRLMVFMPPRSGKSSLISQYFTSWFLGTFPSRRVILASYGARHAATWGRRSRNVFEEFASLWGLAVDSTSHAADRWDVAGHTGGLLTAGVGGGITGHGADLLVVDDPVKDQEEAASRTYRDRAWEWYQSTARTRLEPGGAIIVIQTRWHLDDLSGRLLRQAADDPTADQWTVISFPAIADHEEGLDVIGRQPGEPLWPERFGTEAVEKIRSSMSGYWWSALYQQRPQPPGGSVFQRHQFRYFHTEMIDGRELVVIRSEGDDQPRRYYLDDCWMFQTCDTAMQTGARNDYTAVGTFAVTSANDILVYDMLRARLPIPEQYGMLTRQRQRYPQVLYQAVEERASGIGLIQQAAADGMPFRKLKADASKELRATAIGTAYENGKVYHRAGQPWLGDMENELLDFPHGKHDDQVDVLAYAGLIVSRSAAGRVTEMILYDGSDGDINMAVEYDGDGAESRDGRGSNLLIEHILGGGG